MEDSSIIIKYQKIKSLQKILGELKDNILLSSNIEKFISNDVKSLPIYLARADGVSFSVDKKLSKTEH